ncbi:hypothetical protein BaRGS_00028551 [Batillaria attramentaria]|uniref:Uncharacterized protein n=1 Tax=Batillaria attramentaria TaxID=370345 RepID=A0ABD0JZT8_9CAEN
MKFLETEKTLSQPQNIAANEMQFLENLSSVIAHDSRVQSHQGEYYRHQRILNYSHKGWLDSQLEGSLHHQPIRAGPRSQSSMYTIRYTSPKM